VTGGPPYSQLVARITSADPVRQGEKVVGVALATETNAVVEVICDGDETWVRFRAA
jgi:hypothetical protein